MTLTCIKTIRAMALGLAFAAFSAPVLSQSDADVLLAKEAAQKGQWKVVETLRARLAGHPLESYPAFWQLSATLDRVPAADVQAFLSRYPDGPLAEALRREWLKSLGASAQWDVFRGEFPKLVGEDAEVTCYGLQERLGRDDAEAVGEGRALFLAGREGPGACEGLFGTLAAGKHLSTADAWERIRKVLAANLQRDARRANAMLPPKEAMSEKGIERAAADPAGYLAKDRASLDARAPRELAIYALDRLARSKPDEAARQLEKIAGKMPVEDARYAWGRIALHGAMAHDPLALEWYRNAGDAGLTDTQLAWKARSAMRARDWKALLAAIQVLSPEEAREPTWRYWRARALRGLGEKEAPEALLRGLSRESGFYGLLAADELGLLAAPDWNGWKPEASDLDRIRANPGIARAVALYKLGLDPEGLREWLWAIRPLGDRELLAAAEVARVAGIPDRAINTANRTVAIHDFSQRYPTPHRDALAAASRQWNLDEAFLYGIIRQESRFMPQARSRVGATGLMQLMPATARWVARQIPVQPFKASMLTQPEVNVQMGSYYFHRVANELGHNILATAAYNAGPGRARRWRDERPLEGAIYAETIPFNETRDYVKQVVTNVWFYSHRLNAKVASVKQILGTVPGRAGEPVEAAAVAAQLP